MALDDNDIKSELSYAYLHAVAARAGCSCQHGDRHSDNLGIDARITASGTFAPPPAWTLFHVMVQLKATSQHLPLVSGCYSFRLEKALYNRMRVTTVDTQWILVVLVMPDDDATWLTTSHQVLSLRRCAYWVSLRGAPDPPAGPDDRLTVRIPRQNRFTAVALQQLLVRCAQQDWVTYDA